MKTFSNVASMKLATITAGQFIETGGYYTKGGDGAAKYFIKTAADYGATPDEYGDHTLANGNIAVLSANGVVNVKQFGACPSVSAAIQETAFNAASTASNESVYVSYDTYDLNSGTFTGKFHSFGTPIFTTGTITVLNLNV